MGAVNEALSVARCLCVGGENAACCSQESTLRGDIYSTSGCAYMFVCRVGGEKSWGSGAVVVVVAVVVGVLKVDGLRSQGVTL